MLSSQKQKHVIVVPWLAGSWAAEAQAAALLAAA